MKTYEVIYITDKVDIVKIIKSDILDILKENGDRLFRNQIGDTFDVVAVFPPQAIVTEISQDKKDIAKTV